MLLWKRFRGQDRETLERNDTSIYLSNHCLFFCQYGHKMPIFIIVLVSHPTNDDNRAFRESRKFYPVRLHLDLHIFNLTTSFSYWSKLGIWLWSKHTFASLPRGTKCLYKHFTKCFSIWDLCHLQQCYMQHMVKEWGKKILGEVTPIYCSNWRIPKCHFTLHKPSSNYKVKGHQAWILSAAIKRHRDTFCCY